MDDARWVGIMLAVSLLIAVANGVRVRYRVADGAVVGLIASAVSRASNVATWPGGLVAGGKREARIVAVDVGCVQEETNRDASKEIADRGIAMLVQRATKNVSTETRAARISARSVPTATVS